MEEETEHEAQKLLQEFDAGEGRLDLLVVQCPAEENRKIRDEIITLAGSTEVTFLFIEADTIRAQIIMPEHDPDNRSVTEETVRTFEDAGWRWG